MKYRVLLLLMFLSLQASAQLVDETFNDLNLDQFLFPNGSTYYFGEVPSTWQEYDQDQNPPFFSISDIWSGYGWRTTIVDAGTVAQDTVVVSNSLFNNSGTADDWLILPQQQLPVLSNPQEELILRWEDKSLAGGDVYEVRLSVTGNAISDFNTVLGTYYPTNGNAFNLRSIDISSFEGQSVYIAFRNITTNEFYLYLDDIKVYIRDSGFNVELLSFKTNRYFNTNVSMPFDITVRNLGTETITSFIILFSYNNTTYSHILNNLSILPNETESLNSVLPFFLASPQEVFVEASLTNLNGFQPDLDMTDNTKSFYISAVQPNDFRNSVMEVATGTLCGWCPLGIVAVEQLKEQLPEDEFIPIKVHYYYNNDPMCVQEYVTSHNAIGLPSYHLDRHPDYYNLSIGLNSVLPQINDKKSKATPVSLEHNYAYNASTGEVSITYMADFHTPISTEIRFASILKENNMSGTGDEWEQANNYANNAYGPMGGFENLPSYVPASQMVYNDVGRVLIGGYDGIAGSIPNPVLQNETISFTYTFDLPAGINTNEMEIVSMVIDQTTGEIINAVIAKNETLGSTFFVDNSSSIRVYPNPAKDFFTITLAPHDKVVSAKLYDISGKCIKSYEDQPIYSLDYISNGVYILKIETFKGVFTERIIVNRK